jgi:hypothetical protein
MVQTTRKRDRDEALRLLRKVPAVSPASCANAYEALVAAGHDPQVIRTYGCFHTDPLFGGRRAVKRLTGSSYQVPVLVLDDGTVVSDSSDIAAWAQEHPAGTLTPPP